MSGPRKVEYSVRSNYILLSARTHGIVNIKRDVAACRPIWKPAVSFLWKHSSVSGQLPRETEKQGHTTDHSLMTTFRCLSAAD